MYKFIIMLGLIIALTVTGCTNPSDTKDENVPEATEQVEAAEPVEPIAESPEEISTLKEEVLSNLRFNVKQGSEGCFQILIHDKEYEICKGDVNANASVPFEYEFKDDGNIIISYEGNKYNIDVSKNCTVNTMSESLKSLIKTD